MNLQKETIKYFKTRVKELPFHECMITKDWQDKGIANLLISKKQGSGNYVIVIFLVDISCLGLKNALYKFNISSIKYEDYKKKLVNSEGLIKYDISQAHNLIYGAIDYAEELGFKPHKDFTIAEYILDKNLIDNGIDDIEFGNNGKPLYVSGPYDNAKKIIATLNRNLGEGNYDYIVRDDEF